LSCQLIEECFPLFLLLFLSPLDVPSCEDHVDQPVVNKFHPVGAELIIDLPWEKWTG